jgi:hypothetical protein
VRPVAGFLFTATQSLSNSRNYSLHPTTETIRNHLNLNLGAEINRSLSGNMSIQGSVQHIGEYTEMRGPLPPSGVVDYWLAGVTLMKEF